MDQREVWNTIAPYWHDWKEKPLPQVVDFLKDKDSYLDIGCGSRRHLVQGKKIVGTDFSSEMIRLADTYSKKNKIDANFALADACHLPIKDESFDCIVAAAVMHVIPKKNHKLFLGELKRVMKKNAKCIITVWNKDQKKFAGSEKENCVPWNADGKSLMRYYYLFKKGELEKLLKNSGFFVDKIYVDKEGWNIIVEVIKK